MKDKKKVSFRIRMRNSYPWILSALALITGNWTADALSGLFELFAVNSNGYILLLRAAYILLFVSIVILIYRQRRAFFPPHTKYLFDEDAEKRKHLVLFLSNLPKELDKSEGIPVGVTLTNDIFKDIKDIEKLKEGEKKIRWSWEMTFRAIAHHIGKLETITIICSKKSITQAHFFLKICNRYSDLKDIEFYLLAQKDGRDDLTKITCADVTIPLQGYNFESFDQLSKAILSLLERFDKKGYSKQEIMIDITGGQKPTSIVGASVTFNQEVKAQYVQTNKPWNVLSYDVQVGSADTGNFGL